MLNILSGQATANVKAFPVKDIEIIPGDWVKFDASGKLEKVSAAYDGTYAVFPAYTFNKKQYDNLALNKVDVVTSAACVLETDVVEAVTFAEGSAVTISANGKLTTTGATAANKVGFVIKGLANGAVQFVRA